MTLFLQIIHKYCLLEGKAIKDFRFSVSPCHHARVVLSLSADEHWFSFNIAVAYTEVTFLRAAGNLKDGIMLYFKGHKYTTAEEI